MNNLPTSFKNLLPNTVDCFPILATNGFELDATLAIPQQFYLENNEVPVMHYMPRKHFLTLVQSGQLHMTPLNSQSKDIHHGKFPSANAGKPQGMNIAYYKKWPMNRDVAAMFEQHEIKRELTYLHCWHKGHQEDHEMWRAFAEEGSGVCLLSTSKSLLNSLRPFPKDLFVKWQPVIYSSGDEQLPECLRGLAPACKGAEFISEDEVTLMAEIDITQRVHYRGCGRPFEKVSIDLKLMIQKVIFGPMMDESYDRWIRCRIKRRCPWISIEKSCFRGKWL